MEHEVDDLDEGLERAEYAAREPTAGAEFTSRVAQVVQAQNALTSAARAQIQKLLS